ncbi:hypothetical protein A3A71_02175 [Candidatus Berkelbacteria bacterium RIFCSPLOWO2_01_FULL_50_28]|uniref:Uncharacterized protein n=1 Tax=Candidatus Berkelbacteria bacterium RIFCSPLOWO2_01_FULL_50_28 TaxID=1797471 RepID=A0A1F5EC03_9BACT|nr:MAG: hypothetical protein A2807_00570 [Candidatus Berkelbacteria bacterium RIFCSPHIGHO2_01_FULL_50_36]OGD62188.1 MAG: hypothetical protein A3F39_00590 [Candidatus Berkelbacteria bacterium RIFCSPHIGHO2_12_FULL_50_11]OGD64830.1 MAG: hypothetical protein A3A71_02175 [Candidatus Berkelbacteria bacterium RIFCSPLOWO2_01_FULL_50_28]
MARTRTVSLNNSRRGHAANAGILSPVDKKVKKFEPEVSLFKLLTFFIDIKKYPAVPGGRAGWC